MIRHKLLGALVLASLGAGEFQAARAQDWSQLTPFRGFYVTPYFLNANVGFTFNVGITIGTTSFGSGQATRNPVQPQLDRTTNGGLTWSALSFFDTSGNSITQFCFVSFTHGFASTAATDNNLGTSVPGGIFETFDQGNHWKKITQDGLTFSGVYATKNAIFASEIDASGYGIEGNIIYSYDDGATWSTLTNVKGLSLDAQPQFQWIYGNRDSLVATVYYTNDVSGGSDTYLVFSTDLGQTWQSSLLDQQYTWGMVALHISPHSCNIIRENEPLGDSYSFDKATQPYLNWTPSLLNLETGAWIFGNDCAMYISYAGHTIGPLQRSTDAGNSWLEDGTVGVGPSFMEIDDQDFQNLSVVGYGAVVYTFENPSSVIQGLWKTTDGGDGVLSEAALAPKIEYQHEAFSSGNDTLTVSQCSPSSAVVFYQNLRCAITKMDSVSLIGLARNQYSLSSTHHNDCLTLPDSTYINFVSIPVGTYPITVNTHFTDDEYNTIDTTLSFTLVVQPGSQAVPMSLGFRQSTITTAAGDTLEIPVYLSGNATLGSTSITLPFGLDTNVLRPIEFLPAISGITAGPLTFSKGTVTVPIQSAGLTISGETLIGTLRCIVYLADTLATTVTLQIPSLNSANAPCTALSLTTDSVNILINGCGDKTLLQFMKTGKMPLEIQSITPNPAIGVAQINFINPASAPISYEVIDALGKTRMRGVTGEDALTLDVSPLPQGVYFFRAFTTGGVSVSRELLILR